MNDIDPLKGNIQLKQKGFSWIKLEIIILDETKSVPY
jgi:hypothetical protein